MEANVSRDMAFGMAQWMFTGNGDLRRLFNG